MKPIFCLTLILLASCGAEQAAPKAALGTDPATQDGSDGQSCTVEDDPAGAVVVCGDERQVLKDGAVGAAGPKGEAGKQGGQGVAGPKGEDGQDGSQGVQGANGVAGQDGDDAVQVWVEAGSGEWIGELLEMGSTEVTVARDGMRFTLTWATGRLTAPYNIYFAGAACSGEARVNAAGSAYYLRNVFRDPFDQALVYQAADPIDQTAWAYVSVMPSAGGPCVTAANNLTASRAVSHVVLPVAYPVVGAVVAN